MEIKNLFDVIAYLPKEVKDLSFGLGGNSWLSTYEDYTIKQLKQQTEFETHGDIQEIDALYQLWASRERSAGIDITQSTLYRVMLAILSINALSNDKTIDFDKLGGDFEIARNEYPKLWALGIVIAFG